LKVFQEQQEDNKKITEAISEQKAHLKAKQDNDSTGLSKYTRMKADVLQEQKNLAVRGITEDILFVTEQVGQSCDVLTDSRLSNACSMDR
jgi:hypothetical protein